ncbi:hypothetical protein [Methylobacterium sp. yr668]|uniref:hypothetical protein n=1 Tax=Methylobacterium sp. yr668 TaxID=1761801 RepID=UPI0008DEAB72|nr:hypothetical protein [Methylobacterium sp. yr668]SFT26583.1 hypothetical protein SAMN04487845_1367 [Methylobacterium sp. yr668]
MAVYFKTNNPSDLLKNFDSRIAQTEPKGKITTWEKLSDGVHYTHKSSNWRNLAFFKAKIENGQLKLNIVRPKDKNVSVEAYGYYHGHLVETFLNHFDKSFTDAILSPLPRDGDDTIA